jgi:hypothetical protein
MWLPPLELRVNNLLIWGLAATRNSKMSNAQLLYLEMHIIKKLDRDIQTLSRCLAHKNLWLRLWRLAADEIPTSGEAIGQAYEEARSWFEKGKGRRMENFEDQVNMRYSSNRLAALTLNGSADSGPSHQLSESDHGK